jgi:hypothetical protein
MGRQNGMIGYVRQLDRFMRQMQSPRLGVRLPALDVSWYRLETIRHEVRRRGIDSSAASSSILEIAMDCDLLAREYTELQKVSMFNVKMIIVMAIALRLVILWLLNNLTCWIDAPDFCWIFCGVIGLVASQTYLKGRAPKFWFMKENLPTDLFMDWLEQILIDPPIPKFAPIFAELDELNICERKLGIDCSDERRRVVVGAAKRITIENSLGLRQYQLLVSIAQLLTALVAFAALCGGPIGHLFQQHQSSLMGGD